MEKIIVTLWITFGIYLMAHFVFHFSTCGFCDYISVCVRYSNTVVGAENNKLFQKLSNNESRQ